MGTKEKTLASVQLVLAERGYVVIGIKPGCSTRYKIGEIVFEACGENLEQPFSIIAETDWRDWIEQLNLIEKQLGLKITPYAYHSAASGEAFY